MSGRAKVDDPQLRLSVEWGTLWPIMLARREKAQVMLAQVTAILSPPLHRWFSDPACRAIAVAMDAAVRNEISPTSEGVLAYLAGLPHATMFEIVTGKPVAPWKAVEYDQSALAAIGGYNATSPSTEMAEQISGTFSGSPTTLRSLVERDEAIAELRAAAKRIGQCDLNAGPSEVVSQLIGRLSTKLAGRSGSRNLGECLTSAVEQAEQQAELRGTGNSYPVTWGIPALDLLCPLRPGGMYVLSAPPGAGKTSLALQSAAATAQVGGRGSVAICSLEMTGEELATILVARELNIGPSSIREWTPAAVSKRDQIRQIAAQWGLSEAMMVRDQGTTGQGETADGVVSWLRQRRMVSQGRLGLAVIDYLGLLVGKDRAREYDTLTAATRTIKRAAMSLRIPILLLAQMNREGRKAERDKQGNITVVPEPRLEDLRGSGSIEQDADAVIFIHLPDQKAPGPTVNGRIIVAKQRGGATGSIDVTFSRRHQLFGYCGLPPEMDQQPQKPADDRMTRDPSPEEDHFFGGAAQ